ncbi:DEAD/DEAH box helicase [Exiguobacterium oxidotolerans]|uniref:DEAD/DEAH box helicase n=1 Tax=Exiguobacterium oxidotolerans TaxID=223958 RepID=UPI0004944FA3|nr:SNF2-related protein [Exiguobacterium oxidotolerans]
MNFGLSERKIKQMSDTYAFRRGKRYVTAKKVTLRNYSPGDLFVEAEVAGESRFHVHVHLRETGVDAGCNCPSLAMDASFCGHIVAVLLALQQIQAYGTTGPNRPAITPFSARPAIEDAAAATYLATLTSENKAQLRFDVRDGGIALESLTTQRSYLLSLPYFDRLLNDRDGLRERADIWMSAAVRGQLVSGSPRVKLALDRIHTRLEVVVTFDYDGKTINPLSPTDWVGRDLSTEQAVVRYLEEMGFRANQARYVVEGESRHYVVLKGLLDPMVALGQLELYATASIKTALLPGPFHPKIEVNIKKRLDWLTFKFSMDGISEQELSAILASLVTQKTYHRLRSGQLLSLEDRAFKQIKRLLLEADATERQLLEAELTVPALPNLSLLTPAAFLTVHSQLKERLLEMKAGKTERLALPEPLATQLLPYQQDGVRFFKSLAAHDCHGILADEMGLGKTIQAIGYIETLPSARILIVAPASLLYNWAAELRRFAPTRTVHVLSGSRASRLRQLEDLPDDVILVISYPSLRLDIKNHQAIHYDCIFFDEAQQLKNPRSQTTVSLKQLWATRRFALTGTPLENRTLDLWSIFDVVFPSLLPDRQRFLDWSARDVQQFVEPFLLRRTKQDVLQQLPAKQVVHHYTELTAGQKKLYAAHLAKLQLETLQHLDQSKPEERIKLLAGLTRLRQICCDPRLFVEDYRGRSAKQDRLLALIQEKRAAGKRILIFSQFTKMLDLIRDDLHEMHLPHFELRGDTPIAERLERCDRFNAGEVDLFLISLKAGGTGLNLATADTVILYDSWWNPAVEQQAADRAHRMGQKQTVEVIKLITKGTIEEKIIELQERKATLVTDILKQPDSLALSVDEMVQLLE